MDILESLTADFDRLRDLTIDFALAETFYDRERAFRKLVRHQDVTAKAQASVLETQSLAEIEFAKRKILDLADTMDEIAMSLSRMNGANCAHLRDAKMDLYSDLVIHFVSDGEREILPSLFEKMSEDERVRMGTAYEKYRALALD
jgi:hypothetical protein